MFVTFAFIIVALSTACAADGGRKASPRDGLSVDPVLPRGGPLFRQVNSMPPRQARPAWPRGDGLILPPPTVAATAPSSPPSVPPETTPAPTQPTAAQARSGAAAASPSAGVTLSFMAMVTLAIAT
ncbi:Uncharacterized protein PBTT_04548 [Plasmodiophora brassicae]|uniref:Uncharacterized protein n=1 Tax=Plasmodiophora brassicae TaxID=37360 RepID=A0A0G4IYA0_PLABS|nr:hypothetical protein PBRA_007941 [Plasmodiophora brassicae]SPQ96475.1 unnamed protein product [Plasmodiophora brassicae]